MFCLCDSLCMTSSLHRCGSQSFTLPSRVRMATTGPFPARLAGDEGSLTYCSSLYLLRCSAVSISPSPRPLPSFFSSTCEWYVGLLFPSTLQEFFGAPKCFPPARPLLSDTMQASSHRQIRGETESCATGATNKRAQDVLIGGRFRIQERLGGGAFGEVFKGIEVNSGHPVAMKMELTKYDCRSHLNLESRIYKKFNECLVTIGIPKSYYCGRVGDYTVMVMDLLGPCLEDLFDVCHHKFNIKTVCMIGIQIIQRLQYLHSVGYLHRDIKPENFVMGLGANSHVVYVIDVGLSKAWRDSKGKHIPYAEGRSLTGTARYVSINTHQGIQQSRRDDLESVSYMLAYFVRGSLPWQGLKSPKRDVHFERIRDIKIATPPAELCKGCPHQLTDYLAYTRSLEFEEEPNYRHCVELLSAAIRDMGEEYDYCYQWINGSEGESTSDARGSVQSPRVSGAHSGVAVRGSNFMTSSIFMGDSAANEMSKSQPNSNFTEDMQDIYGLNDYL